MNRNQWMVLGIIFIGMGSWFIFLDLDTAMWSDFDLTPHHLTEYDVYNIINSEIYDPFIWMFHFLGFTCFIMSFLEKEEK